jgi:hypothetical protein
MDLTLAERLLLIALDDEKGHDTTSYSVDHGLAGAVLLDLAAQEAVRTAGDDIVADGPEPNDPLLKDAYTSIRDEPKPKKAKAWISQLQKDLKPIKARVAARLVDNGVLTEKDHKTLGLFKTKRFPEANPEPEQHLRRRLAAVLTGTEPPRGDDAVLIALLNAYDLPKKLVPKDDRKEAKKRAKEIADNGIAGEAVAKALKDIESAVMIAVVASATTSVAASSGS